MSDAPTKKKRAKPINARALTVEKWRKLGYLVWIVERSISHGEETPGIKPNPFQRSHKVDLFEFADLIAYKPGKSELAFIQAASAGTDGRDGGHSKHFWKILGNRHAYDLALAGHGVWLATWKRNRETRRYEAKFKQFKPADFENRPATVRLEYPVEFKRRARLAKKQAAMPVPPLFAGVEG